MFQLVTNLEEVVPIPSFHLQHIISVQFTFIYPDITKIRLPKPGCVTCASKMLLFFQSPPQLPLLVLANVSGNMIFSHEVPNSLFHCRLDLQVDGLSSFLPSRPSSPHLNRSVLCWYQVSFSFIHILAARCHVSRNDVKKLLGSYL